ncbi:MAG: TlpA family protein disulfide reductase [bacterium]|nr:TlpA family protein disulfide reductase [bacterium]
MDTRSTRGLLSQLPVLVGLALASLVGIPGPVLAQDEAVWWQGQLESPGGRLPFALQQNGARLTLHHGVEERVITGNLPALSRAETVAPTALRFPPYDASIDGWSADHERRETGPFWRGKWQKVRGSGTDSLACELRPWPRDEQGRRRSTFDFKGAPMAVAGRWRVRFASDPTHDAVAIFGPARGGLTHVPGEITGTFLTVTGDYRFLAGTARGDDLGLAVFDGAHAFLFTGKRRDDGSLRGDFYSGSKWHDTWTAVRDDDAALPDAFTLTKARSDVDVAALSYPDVVTGESTRLGDHFGRVTLIVLFGTWCPNCGDSGAYLKRLRTRFGARGLRVIGLAFEHGTDRARHQRVVAAYRERYAVDWPILLAGSSSKRLASQALPAVDAVRSYPTTLFLDDRGRVRAVHQGFAGPATGPIHAAQCKSFEAIVERLLAAADSRAAGKSGGK